jgi:hypothetical protein
MDFGIVFVKSHKNARSVGAQVRFDVHSSLFTVQNCMEFNAILFVKELLVFFGNSGPKNVGSFPLKHVVLNPEDFTQDM